VIERGRRVAVVGLLAGQNEGQCDSVKRLPLSWSDDQTTAMK